MAYSQHDEDGYILRLINDNKLEITPTFADFGSCDGIHLNNCRLFAEMGWSGVFVEPNPEYFYLLNINYQHRADITIINAAVAGHSGFGYFYYYPQYRDHSGLHSAPRFTDYEIKQVAVVEASNIVNEVGLISIDVEGQEQVILINLFTAGIYPEIIIVESNTEKDRAEQVELLNEKYLLLHTLSVNTIWIRRDKWIR